MPSSGNSVAIDVTENDDDKQSNKGSNKDDEKQNDKESNKDDLLARIVKLLEEI